ncbi:MAG: hypothetical protein O6852_07875 [Gammaproteobacteria bacterium]|nr:hypothetical protein [Gammaproteobacteria bacterium]
METTKIFISCMRLLTLGILIGVGPTVLGAGTIDKIVTTGVQRNEAGKASQKVIDKIAVSTGKLASKYKRELKLIDGL